MATRNHLPKQVVSSFDVYQVTPELITSCRPSSSHICRFNRRLGAQLTESLASLLQNLAKAMRRTGRDRAEQQRVDALADRVCAMSYRLRQRCP